MINIDIAKIPVTELQYTNKKYYLSIGYNKEKINKEQVEGFINIDINKIKSKFSKALIQLKCDYCNTIFERTYEQYNRFNKNNLSNKDACTNCKGDHLKESNLFKYGVTSTAKLEINKNKVKQTCIEKYGTENPQQNKEVRNKTIQTCIDIYGTENISQNKEIQDRRNKSNIKKYGVKSTLSIKSVRDKGKETMMELYGVEHPSQSKELQDKKIDTFIERFGVDHPMKVKKIKDIAIHNSLVERRDNNNINYSKQQKYIYNLYGGEFNFVTDCIVIDIAFPEQKIGCEYIGSGHNLSVQYKQMTEKEFDNKELKRSSYLKKEGWKIFYIVSIKDYLPSDDILLYIKNYAFNFFNNNIDRSWISFDIENRNIKWKDNIIEFDYGETYKLKKID